MKTGRTLVEMVAELERQQATKRDFVAPTKAMTFHATPEKAELTIQDKGVFGINDNAHDQLASYLDIPRKYYDRMREEAPKLLAENVNEWLHRGDERRMARTLDGNVRAFLSNRYRTLDNWDMLNTTLPTIIEKGCNVVSAEVTERKLYIKAISPKVQYEVKKGDVVQAGIVLSNSEVGGGSVRVEPLIYRLVCLNGMIAADSTMRKYHVGRNTQGEGAIEFFKTETLIADDRAFWMKVRDTVAGSFEEINFKAIVDKMTETSERLITADVVGVVEVFQKKLGIQEGERNSILKHLLSGGDLSQWGLVNAITRTSQDIEDYDRATHFERLGGEVLELPRSDWETIAQTH